MAEGRAAVARPAPASRSSTPRSGRKAEVAAKGLPASPGAATGAVVFTADDAVAWSAEGQARRARAHGDGARRHPRHERGPGHPHRHRRHDLTRRGGRPPDGQAVGGRLRLAATSTPRRKKLKVAGRTPARKATRISIDGSTGEVILQELPTSPSEVLQVVNGHAQGRRSRRSTRSSRSCWAGPTRSAGWASAPTPTSRATPRSPSPSAPAASASAAPSTCSSPRTGCRTW